jgi:hypothetical protein
MKTLRSGIITKMPCLMKITEARDIAKSWEFVKPGAEV